MNVRFLDGYGLFVEDGVEEDVGFVEDEVLDCGEGFFGVGEFVVVR